MNNPGTTESRIIVPLDYSDQNQVFELVDKFEPSMCKLKVGKELFTATGPKLIDKLMTRGFDIFLDLKFHDIPTTVAKACCAAASLGIWMVNVHAMGGQKMLALVREEIDKLRYKPLVIAVTVLTSMNESDLKQLGINCTVQEQVLKLATLAKNTGLDGIVCSALEATMMRKEFGKEFCLVTPGIRPSGSKQDDQSRIMTPREAISAGSDYLVIGRPITQSPDPLQALININEEINTAIKN